MKSSCPRVRQDGTWRMEVQIRTFLIGSLMASESSASRCGRKGLPRVESHLPSTGFVPRTVHSVAIRYTDNDVPPPRNLTDTDNL